MFKGLASSGLRATTMRTQPARGMATEQQLRMRISAVKNIKKITSAMKMVAVCKLRVAQENLEKARAFSRSVDDLGVEPKDDKFDSHLWVGISSDRGLCGAINSSVTRSIRESVKGQKANGMENVKVVLMGEKVKQGLERLMKEHFTTTLSETGKFKPCTFKQCGLLTDFWLKEKFDKSTVTWQNFKSMISYITTETPFWSYERVKDDMQAQFADYEMEGDSDILQNLHEFRASVKLYHFFAENEASTLSARMSAMDNSSNNADDMISSLTLLMNRNRQAKITTELSEIISGAAAVDDV